MSLGRTLLSQLISALVSLCLIALKRTTCLPFVLLICADKNLDLLRNLRHQIDLLPLLLHLLQRDLLHQPLLAQIHLLLNIPLCVTTRLRNTTLFLVTLFTLVILMSGSLGRVSVLVANDLFTSSLSSIQLSEAGLS